MLKSFSKALLVIALVFTLVFLMVPPLWASLGKIAGTVKDAKTGEPLPGANVIIVGTTLGASADAEGRYFILNVPPGTYDVEARMMGYEPLVKTGVIARLDMTTTVDFELTPTVIEAPEAIVVVAERPLVDPTLTASRTSIGAEELNNKLPVANIDEIIETTASSYRHFVRGGQLFETKTLIDGVDISDTYYSRGDASGGWHGFIERGYNQIHRGRPQETVLTNASAVAELDVLAGTFNAEYPAATAGVVNIVTKQGGPKFSGSAFYRRSVGKLKHFGPDVYFDYEDYYVPNRDELLASTDPAKQEWGRAFDWTPGKYNYGDKPTQELEVSLGGPLTARGNFYVTGRFYQNYGPYPNEYERKLGGSLKLNYALSPSIKLRTSFLIDEGGYFTNHWNRDFNDGWKYDLEDIPQYQTGGLMASATLTHTLSPKTFYELQISHVYNIFMAGFPDENGNIIKFEGPADSTKYYGDGNGYRDVDGTKEIVRFHHAPRNALNNITYQNWGNNWFLVRWPGIYYEKRPNKITSIKGDFTSQVTHQHQLKAGFQIRLHNVSQDMKMDQVYIPKGMWYEHDKWNFKPKEYSFYAQDRIEYAGMIVNVGLRLDGFNSDAKQITNFFAPLFGKDWDNPANVGSDGKTGPAYKWNRGKDPETKWMLSPRLGISHPVTENLAMHYSWGKFYQMPNFSQLYDQYDLHCTSIFPAPNPDLDPIRTTSYEMGLQYSPLRDYRLLVAAYYRDVDNYANSTISIKTGNQWGTSWYHIPINFGYADSRGVEVTLSKRPGGLFSGRLSYTYSYAKESVGGLGNKQQFTKADSAAGIPWDDLKRLNSYERPKFGGRSSFYGGQDRTHRITASILFDLPYDIFVSTTTVAASGFWYDASIEPRERNFQTGPWNAETNLRIEKGFRVGGYRVGAFLEIRNLFDKANVLGFQTKWTEDTTLFREGGTTAYGQKVDKGHPTGQFGRVVFDDGSPVYGPRRTTYVGVNFTF